MRTLAQRNQLWATHSEDRIGNLSVQFAVIGSLAIGTTAVIICREIDLSIGAVEGICAVVAGLVGVVLGMPWPLAAAAIPGLLCLRSAING